jgi:hypothetical protein
VLRRRSVTFVFILLLKGRVLWDLSTECQDLVSQPFGMKLIFVFKTLP